MVRHRNEASAETNRWSTIINSIIDHQWRLYRSCKPIEFFAALRIFGASTTSTWRRRRRSTAMTAGTRLASAWLTAVWRTTSQSECRTADVVGGRAGGWVGVWVCGCVGVWVGAMFYCEYFLLQLSGKLNVLFFNFSVVWMWLICFVDSSRSIINGGKLPSERWALCQLFYIYI